MSVNTDMRLGERTHDFSYIPATIDQLQLQPYDNNVNVNDELSQYNKSSFNRNTKPKTSYINNTINHSTSSQQQIQIKYNNLKNEYNTLCNHIQNMKRNSSHFETNLNTYRKTPLSKQSKLLKSKVTDKAHQKPLKFSNTVVKSTPYYTKEVLDKLARTEYYAEVGTPKEIYNTIKDKVVERSLYLYSNKHCHTCAQCLSLGLSSYKCPKCHHLNVYE